MKLSLIVPVYNEQETIEIFYQKIRSAKFLADYIIEIIFINDGSYDQTEEIIQELEQKDHFVQALSFTRNFGKEPALIAGLNYATGEAVIPIDVDLQDPIELIPQMIDAWMKGAEIVLAKRVDRLSDSWPKRVTAYIFYRLHNKIS